ncbi:MAG: hypothetical protein QOH97_2934 [Actinoplanes sp.]|jgi:predicted O-methyltransferase YrrM|nr:hypothetical protein [Actinoplanes sp.]
MSSLRRIGRRGAERLRMLSRRQATAFSLLGALGLTAVGAALTRHQGTALAVLAVLITGLLAGLLALVRRVGGIQRANLAAQRDLRTTVEQMQRRLVAAVEKERLAGGDRQAELTDTLARNHRLLERSGDLLLRAQSREIEAMLQLFQGFTPRAPMPSSGDFALNPTDLLELLHLIHLHQPRLVVELGSGTSSVWIAYALEKTGGRLISLDHDAGYAAKTRALLAAHGLAGVAEVRDAPLTPITIAGTKYQWYDVAQLADLRGIDLLLVDGPPEATGPAARFPAMHALEQRLSSLATIVIDDANRQGEQAALASWTQTFAGLSREHELLGRHAVLSYRRSGQPAPVPS